MSISINGQSRVPPGFRFHPTEEELLQYYLRKKVCYQKIDLDVIRDVDLNKLEPWDIQETCKIGSTPQNDWYFFSHKDKKYPTGTRTNRATAVGFWKATGRDKVIYSNGGRIGMRKTLVFYKGRAPHGQKSDWIMHEYRLDDNPCDTNHHVSNVMGEGIQEEGWVVCRVFKKKNLHKTLHTTPSIASSVTSDSTTQMFDSSDEGTLEQILMYMGRTTCKDQDDEIEYNSTNISSKRFMKLPNLESPKNSLQCDHPNLVYHSQTTGLSDWSTLDRLVASQLNGQTETSKDLASFTEPTMGLCSPIDHDHHLQIQPNNEFEIWSFARSSLLSADQSLYHMPNHRV